jgi:hypothetical protein
MRSTQKGTGILSNTAPKYPSEITEDDQPVIFEMINLAKNQQCRRVSELRVLFMDRFPEVDDEQFERCMKIIGRRIMSLEVEQECQTSP